MLAPQMTRTDPSSDDVSRLRKSLKRRQGIEYRIEDGPGRRAAPVGGVLVEEDENCLKRPGELFRLYDPWKSCVLWSSHFCVHCAWRRLGRPLITPIEVLF